MRLRTESSKHLAVNPSNGNRRSFSSESSLARLELAVQELQRGPHIPSNLDSSRTRRHSIALRKVGNAPVSITKGYRSF